LLARQLSPIQWAIPDILPEGLTILAGKPKLGKSWLALALAFAVAAGGVAMGTYPVTQGEVLYLALEDNERRLQSRAKQLLASMSSVPDAIAFELRWPRMDQGGLAYLEEYLQTHPHVRLVVVDTWARVLPKSSNRQRSQYEDDYEALTPLKYLADTYRVSILAIHHLRKMRGDDVLDEITGSIGLTGVVDGALILKRERGQHEATLFVTGRDIEQEQHFALSFDPLTAMWTLVGNAEEVKRTKERQEILDLLSEQHPEGLSARQVAEALDKNYHTTRCLLRKMECAGEIQHARNLYLTIAGEGYGNQCHQRNHCNQSEPSLQRCMSQVEYREEPCPSGNDYGDYSDYAHQHVSEKEHRMQSIRPPFGGCSLQFPSVTKALLTGRSVAHYAQDHQFDCAISVINRNHCNQSMPVFTQASVRDDDINTVSSRNHRNQSTPATIQGINHVGQPSPTSHDYGDYAVAIDYSDNTLYANESVSTCWSQTLHPGQPLAGVSSQYQPAEEDLRIEKEGVRDAQDHRVDYEISVINRNHRDHYDLQHSRTALQTKHLKSESNLDNNDTSPGKARASPFAQSKKRCPHHPHARWVRFDPSGQAWCDKMDCWDCYRLVKIGETLDYRPLSKYARGIVSVGQGMETWSSFVTSHGSFEVLTATQYAIDLCKASKKEVPDLSGEVKRLVSAGDEKLSS
jgi:hypothetical protein